MRTEELATLRTLVEAGALGVSADNGQPWSFRWRASHLWVDLDSKRAQSFFDRQQFAAIFGLGSVLENFSIAAAHHGFSADTELLTRDHGRAIAPIARIRLVRSHAGSDPLYPEIDRRSTNRRPYRRMSVPTQIQTALATPFADAPSTRLVLVDHPGRIKELASLTAQADRIRFDFSSVEIHKDFFDRVRFTKAEAEKTRDGLWVSCLEVKAPDRVALRFLARWPVARLARYAGVARVFARQTRVLLRRTPLVALVVGKSPERRGTLSGGTTPDDEVFLQGGRLCQRFWLTASNAALACQPMAVLPLFFAQYGLFGKNGFPEEHGETVGRLREAFHEQFALSSNEHLLMVFRVGYAPPPSGRSFRRAIEELLTIEDESSLVSV